MKIVSWYATKESSKHAKKESMKESKFNKYLNLLQDKKTKDH